MKSWLEEEMTSIDTFTLNSTLILFGVIVIVLMFALLICMRISKKHKLYETIKKEPAAYTKEKEEIVQV